MRLVILDRDGVINEDSDAYIKSAEEWQPIAGSLAAIARWSLAGYRVAVASNQSGLARGLFDLDALQAIHRKMQAAVLAAGGVIDAVFFCPHGPADGCSCRKPAPGLLLEIGRRYGIDLSRVPAIGDSARDAQAARAAGAQPFLVRTGKGQGLPAGLSEYDGVPVFADLLQLTESFLSSRS